ncbi:MAG: DUF4190 domain-containing protein [Oscillospiraceae bacterium]|jgi:hypothetical protein|nr:DUF4190 domain-containing protein [Oscillospiraceae bacterium]
MDEFNDSQDFSNKPGKQQNEQFSSATSGGDFPDTFKELYSGPANEEKTNSFVVPQENPFSVPGPIDTSTTAGVFDSDPFRSIYSNKSAETPPAPEAKPETPAPAYIPPQQTPPVPPPQYNYRPNPQPPAAPQPPPYPQYPPQGQPQRYPQYQQQRGVPPAQYQQNQFSQGQGSYNSSQPPYQPGQQYQPYYAPPAKTGEPDGLGIASLVTGVISILSSCFVVPGFIFSIAAIILGAIGRSKKKSGMALAGLIIGIVMLLIMIFIAAVIAAIGNSDSSFWSNFMDSYGNYYGY